jgi:hypothetical protein
MAECPPPVPVFHFFVLSRGDRHFSGSDGINGQDPNTTSIILFGSLKGVTYL